MPILQDLGWGRIRELPSVKAEPPLLAGEAPPSGAPLGDVSPEASHGCIKD